MKIQYILFVVVTMALSGGVRAAEAQDVSSLLLSAQGKKPSCGCAASHKLDKMTSKRA